MKRIQSKTIRIAVTVVAAGAALYAIMSIIDNIGVVTNSVAAGVRFILSVLAPVLIGFAIAFLLNRPSDFFARIAAKIKPLSYRHKACHGLGVLAAFVVFIALIAAFFYLMVPGIVESVSSISRDIPGYTETIDAFLGDLSENKSVAEVLGFVGFDITRTNTISSIVSEFWTEITAFLQGVTGTVVGFIVNTGLFLYNFVLGLFFAVYMLLFKRQLKSQIRTLSRNVLAKSHYKRRFMVSITDDMFYRFLVGKGICSLAVGIVTFAACSLIGFKYSPLISLIIAVTNMIPTFGPFIGAIPALLLALMTAPPYALYMLIIILAVQFVDGNILGPRVLGESMGLNGFWVMFSIILFGALFGVMGMLVAAPVFGILRIVIKNWIYHKNHGVLEGEAEYEASLARYKEWTAKKKK